jgi:hypothetical protein
MDFLRLLSTALEAQVAEGESIRETEFTEASMLLIEFEGVG